MFKLKSINGARYNAPEIVEVTVTIPNGCNAGELYYFADGALYPHAGTYAANVFVPLSTLATNNKKVKVKGYYINSNMLFETKLYGNAASVGVGSAISAYVDDTNTVLGVSSAKGEFAIIHDMDEFEKTGRITVRLN